jgi:hypothetical protein
LGVKLQNKFKMEKKCLMDFRVFFFFSIYFLKKKFHFLFKVLVGSSDIEKLENMLYLKIIFLQKKG